MPLSLTECLFNCAEITNGIVITFFAEADCIVQQIIAFMADALN